MADKIFGDLDIFGVITVGSRTDGISGAYTLPFQKGDNGTILGIAQAPSSTGLSGTMPQWLLPTDAPFNLVNVNTLNTLVSSTSAATLYAANQFALSVAGGGNVFGTVSCDTSNYIYQIIDSRIHPSANIGSSLKIPYTDAVNYETSVTDVVSGSFRIVLSGVPSVTGYSLQWVLYNPI